MHTYVYILCVCTQQMSWDEVYTLIFLEASVSSFSECLCVCFSECDSEIVHLCCAVNPLCLSGFPLISARELTLAQVSCAGP